MKPNKVIAVTGGIGCGKSTALNIIKDLGYPTFSCDEAVKSLYKKRRILKKLQPLFTTAIKGKLFLKADKKEIARICFSNKDKLKELESVLTVPAFNLTMKKAKKYPLSFIEVPLLFEYNLQSKFDQVIIINRSLTERIESVKVRSNMTQEDVENVIKNQFDYDTIDKTKYIVINHDSNIIHLKQSITEILKSI